MTAVTNPDIRNWTDGERSDWDEIRSSVLARDEHTCQRCKSAHEEDSHHLHIHRFIGPLGRSGLDRFVTLCHPCHAVQHPKAPVFDEWRADAPVFPALDSKSDVAIVNTEHPNYDESEEAVWLRHRAFDRDGYTCHRCREHGVSPHSNMDGLKLTTYIIDEPIDYGFVCVRRILTVCQPCQQVLRGERDEYSTGQPLLPHSDAHPAVAQPRPPQTDGEKERVRQFLVEKCIERDGPHCSRCQTHTSDSSTEYPHNNVSLYFIGDDEAGERWDPTNYLLVCSPCCAALMPADSALHQFLPAAQQDPHENAHSAVDVKKTYYRPESMQTLSDETIRTRFEKDSHQCQRCMSEHQSGANLVAYPEFDTTADVIERPIEKYTTMCRSCAGVVYHTGDGSATLDDLHTLEELTESELHEASRGARPTPRYPGTGGIVDVERDPVNQKEQILSESPFNTLHTAWRLLGTVSIATVVFLWSLHTLLSSDYSLSVSLGGGMTVSLWLEVVGGLVLFSFGVAVTVRWFIADASERFWEWLDPTFESTHYRVDARYEWTRTMQLYEKGIVLPYIALVAVHIAFTLLRIIHYSLF